MPYRDEPVHPPMRRGRLAAATLCLATAAAGTAGATPAGAGGASPAGDSATTNALANPNVVMIMADDLGYDQISLNGGPIATPNIDRIAQRGARFTDGYVASPVCSPSRHALLTGRHPARKGNNSNWQSRTRPERVPSPTVANLLKERGYTTKAVGKWDLAGFSGRWDDNNVTLPHDAGFDRFYGTLRGMENYCAGNGKIWRYTGDGYNGIYPGDYPSQTNTKYMTHEYNDNAEQFVRNHRDDANPFFLYLSYTAPHAPLQTPETCPNRDVSASTYQRMVQIMDNGIGRVLDALGTEADNTMVVFVSDHGSQFSRFFPSDLRDGKYTLFEGGLRVPFTMSWPAGLGTSPVTYREMVSTLDLLPTIAAATGAGVSGYPGRDLVPYLNGSRTGSPHDRLHWRYVNDEQTPDQGAVSVAIRSGDYKYLRTTGVDGAAREHLYDLSTDIGEQNNLAADPGYAAVKDRLIGEHNAWNRHNRKLEGFQNPRPGNQPRAGKPDGFISYGGDWNVVAAGGDKEYRGIADGLAGRVMLPGAYYDDVDANVSIRLADRGQGGLIVRGTSAPNSPYGLTGYVVRLISPPDTSKPERVVLNRVVDGTSVEVRSLNRNVDPGVSYRLGVKMVGATVTVSVNGTPQFNWTDSTPITGGGLGLRVVGATAYFDGLSAEQLGGINAVGPMPLADPDTIQLPGPEQRYVSYGTSRDGNEIPYVIHGSGNTVGMDGTIDGDAMPGGPGAWARDDIGLWAPSVVRYNGTFYLFYTATQTGTGNPGRKCIGVATSAHALGPFLPRANPLLCNAGGWSIDPDAFVGAFNGNLYLTYRDDRVISRPETALSVVRLNDTATDVITKRVLFKSTQITWETVGISDGQSHVIENPSMVRRDGRWWLFYSGNRWQTAKYATGIASCGESPTAASCTPHPGPHRPWFGYVGPEGLQDPHAPMRQLPGNHKGPGGMSVFFARDDSMRAVWHYHPDDGGRRVSRTGVLRLDWSTDIWTVHPE